MRLSREGLILPKTIRSYLILLVLAVAVPLLAFALVQTRNYARVQQENLERNLVERAQAVAASVQKELDVSIAALDALAAVRELDANDLAGFYEAAGRVRSTERWFNVWLIDPTGRQLFTLTRPYGAELPSLAEREYFQRILTTRRPAVSGLVKSQLIGYNVAVAVPVMRDGDLKYVLAAGFRPEKFAEILASNPGNKPERVVASIVDQDYTIITRTIEPEKWVGKRATPAYIHATEGKTHGLVETMSAEGRSVYVAFTKLQNVDWTIGYGVPVSDVQAPLRRAMTAAALLGVIGVFASVVAAVLVGRRINEPVVALAAAADDLRRSGHNPVQTSSHIAELRALADAFNRARLAVEEREALLEREKEALKQSDRAKDEFIAMLSHELRNPLAALSSAADLLSILRPEQIAASDVRGVIKRQTRQMSHLVEDLLDVSRVAMGKAALNRQALDLAETCREVVETMKSTGRFAAHELLLRLDSVWVNADRARLQQIVTNLLDNAVKFAPAGTRVDMRVRREHEDAVLCIADQGIGVDTQLARQVFDLFVQGPRGLDREKGGLGIGLALVKRLVEMHGGTVSVSSEGAGRGATFIVRLPAVSTPAGIVQVTKERRREPRGGRRILLIEDNDDVRQMLRMSLSQRGHIIYEARDGESGVQLANEIHPDILLVDIGLPGIDGYEVARRLRNTPELRLSSMVAMTGYGQPKDKQRALEAGFDKHLTKPVPPEALDEIIASVA
jgi:signal transduction histidine kinase